MTPFSVTLRSEWTKLASLRGTWVKLAMAFVLSVGLTALLALIVGATWDDASAADRASHDPVGIGLFGSLFSMIVFAVIGATAVTSEYGSCPGSSVGCCRGGGARTRSTSRRAPRRRRSRAATSRARPTGWLAPGVVALILAAWLAAFLGAAWPALERRDA